MFKSGSLITPLRFLEKNEITPPEITPREITPPLVSVYTTPGLLILTIYSKVSSCDMLRKRSC